MTQYLVFRLSRLCLEPILMNKYSYFSCISTYIQIRLSPNLNIFWGFESRFKSTLINWVLYNVTTNKNVHFIIFILKPCYIPTYIMFYLLMSILFLTKLWSLIPCTNHVTSRDLAPRDPGWPRFFIGQIGSGLDKAYKQGSQSKWNVGS